MTFGDQAAAQTNATAGGTQGTNHEACREREFELKEHIKALRQQVTYLQEQLAATEDDVRELREKLAEWEGD